MSQLTSSRVRELLDYNRDTGVCIWKIARKKIPRGSVAGCLRRDGYINIGIDGEKHLLHRVIYLRETGNWPSDQIDHRDLNRSNNRWSNLRPATRSQNLANSPLRKNNKSGFKGVTLSDGKYWCAMIRINKKAYHLGHFDTAEEAHSAYLAAAAKGFGDFHRAS